MKWSTQERVARTVRRLQTELSKERKSDGKGVIQMVGKESPNYFQIFKGISY